MAKWVWRTAQAGVRLLESPHKGLALWISKDDRTGTGAFWLSAGWRGLAHIFDRSRSISNLKGKLNRWNDAKGFGFIGPGDGGRDVFIHISALRKLARRPLVGDVISFEVHLDNNGKKRAVNASIEGVASIRTNHNKPGTNTAVNISGIPGRLLVLILFLGAGAAVYSVLHEKSVRVSSQSHSQPFASRASEEKSGYSCTGKTRCSEMVSCDEARFYLNNCPGTRMDGDADGIPCEQQFCGR